MQNVLSIDFECFITVYQQFNRSKENKVLSSSQRKKKDNGYIVHAAESLLKILSETETKATFFVVAEIYEWYPEIIEQIQAQGHEIGYHTHSHRRIFNRGVLEQEIKKSRLFLRTFRPEGFRAPQMYLTKDCFEVLKKNKFRYDSSSYDVYHAESISGIMEVPVSVYRYRHMKPKSNTWPKQFTLTSLARQFPAGSGFAFNLMGNNILSYAQKLNGKGLPFIMFLHPWQIARYPAGTFDLTKGALENPLMAVYYINRKQAFRKLLKQCSFTTFKDFLNSPGSLQSKKC